MIYSLRTPNPETYADRKRFPIELNNYCGNSRRTPANILAILVPRGESFRFFNSPQKLEFQIEYANAKAKDAP